MKNLARPQRILVILAALLTAGVLALGVADLRRDDRHCLNGSYGRWVRVEGRLEWRGSIPPDPRCPTEPRAR